MKIALAGIGKIARDQHVPSIATSEAWDLAATVSRSGQVDGIEAFTGIDEMLAARPDIPVVSLCLPPLPRFDYAMAAIAAGRHVMLEKPPGATLAECRVLEAAAREAGVVLFATWHSRMAAGVARAKAWLADRAVTSARIDWREDVRRWHPGQDWIFEPGGMGVFDPGINALSIATEILPFPLRLTGATLIYPENRQTPIAADLAFADGVSAGFDWRQEGDQTWTIAVETDDGSLRLTDGGARLEIDGKPREVEDIGEYPALYDRMADLVASGKSDVDLSPMILVADAFTLGERQVTAAFHF